MSVLENAKELKSLLRKVVSEVVKEETRSCFRVYKARVVTTPYTTSDMLSVCEVRLDGDQTILTIPYSSRVQTMTVGDAVLVATVYDSFRNAIVWEFQTFK